MKRWMERSCEHLTSWSISAKDEQEQRGPSLLELTYESTQSIKVSKRFLVFCTLEALDSLRCNVQQHVLDSAARLKSAAVGVNVDVAHGPLDANTAIWGP